MFAETSLRLVALRAARAAVLLLVSLAAGIPAAAQESFCQSGTCAVEITEGWIKGPEGPVYATYERIDGRAVLGGDILVEEIDPAARLGRAAIVSDRTRLWPSGVMPYTIAPGLSRIDDLEAAIDHVNALTGLTIVPRTNQTDYVEFIEADGCWSWIGVQTGRQEASIGANCGFGAAVHEILHAAGVYHEHSRDDRDQHVTIHFDNIESGREYAFEYRDAGIGIDAGPYDFHSIMHYGSHAFSTNGQATIIPHLAGVTIGQRQGLSLGDISGLAPLYGGVLPTISEEIRSGLARSGVFGSTNSQQYFHMEVPEGAEGVTFDLSVALGEADILVAFDREPNGQDFDCSTLDQSGPDVCEIANPSAGTWYVDVVGRTDFADGIVEGRYEGALTPVAVRKLVIKDGRRRKFILKAEDSRIQAPDSIAEGAELRIVNPATGEVGTISLPARLWDRKPNGTLRFQGRSCKVTVKDAGKLKVRCSTAGGFTLDEDQQERLGVELHFGEGGFCAGLAGTPKVDRPRSSDGSPAGMFTLAGAPRPDSCSY